MKLQLDQPQMNARKSAVQLKMKERNSRGNVFIHVQMQTTNEQKGIQSFLEH